MEHSFKRRKVSQEGGNPHSIHHYRRSEPLAIGGSETSGRKLRSRAFGSPHPPKLFSENTARSSKDFSVGHSKIKELHPRNLVPSKAEDAVEAVKSPSNTVVASVIQVVVNNGSGDRITQVLVPVASKIVSVNGFAPITLGKGSAASSPTPTAAANSKPNPKQSSRHQQPSPTNLNVQNSYGSQTSASPASRTGSPLRSQGTAGSTSASSSSLLISVSNSKSQVVLSSPPSTPLPSTPASSTSPSSSAGSYFSSSARGEASTASSSNSAAAATQINSAQGLPAPSTSNLTLTTNSPTASGTTSTSPTLLSSSLSTLNPNSTLVTSTQSRSSFASSTSLSSSVSSISLSSSRTSTIGSLASSQTTFSSSSASFSQSSSSTSSTASTSTGILGGGIGGSGNTGSAPSSTASSSAGSGGGSSINKGAVAGGVVGGVAGLALILLLLLFLLRRRRSQQRRTISPPVPQSLPPGVASTAPTTERSSIVPFASSAFMRRMRPSSGQTAASGETAPSERGFQNFGGRKLESVLSSRGDGYNDPVPPSGVAPRGYAGTAAGLGLAAGLARGPGQGGPGPGPSDNETLSGSSFYRDSHGFYGGEGPAGPSSPSPTSPTSPQGSPPGEEPSYMRPGPARTPVIHGPAVTRTRNVEGAGRGIPGTPPTSSGAGRLTPQVRPQDEIGRSHPSFDGSRGSRFSEAIS